MSGSVGSEHVVVAVVLLLIARFEGVAVAVATLVARFVIVEEVDAVIVLETPFTWWLLFCFIVSVGPLIAAFTSFAAPTLLSN